MIRQQISERPVWLTSAVLVVAVLGVAFVTVWGGLWARVAGAVVDSESSSSNAPIAYALIVEHGLGERTYTSEVVAFDETSGKVIARLQSGDEPNVLPDPSGEKIYLLQTKWDTLNWPRTGTEVLSVIDTETWQEIDSTTVTKRVQYTLAGPPVLVRSPDGTRLVVYSTNQLGDYWLEIYDAVTLERLSGEEGIVLPRGCGGTPIVTTRAEVVLLCGTTREGNDSEGIIPATLALHFIEVNSAQVTASVPLPDSGLYVKGKPVGIEVTDDGSTIYVVFNDLLIIEIDAATHRVTREVTTWRSDEPTVFGVEMSNDGHLLVGVASDLTTWENLSLHRFELPSLELLDPISVQQHPRFAAGPDGDLYQWERGTTDLRRLDLDDGSVMDISLGGDKTLIADIVRSE